MHTSSMRPQVHCISAGCPCVSSLAFPFLPPQDGKVHLYSIQGNTLKKDSTTMEAKGPVTDMAYSSDGAYLAVTDEKKVVTVFSVADGYSVNTLLSHRFYLCD